MKNPKDFNTILERIHSAEHWRDSCYKDKWDSNLRQYHSILENKRNGYSNIFVPYTFMQVEVIKARVNESLFAQEPWVTLFPRGEEDTKLAETFQTLLNWQFSERVGIKRQFAEDITSDACIFGTVVTYTGWRKKERSVKKRRSITIPLIKDGMIVLDEAEMPVMIPSVEQYTEVETVYDDPVVQKVDIYDFFTDPHACNIEDARFCGHVEYLTREQIESLVETNGWKVEWRNLRPADSITGGKENRAQVIGGSLENGAEGTYDQNDKGGLYKVHHYWEDGRHVAIINEEQCAIDEENPFWHGLKPYDKCCYIPKSNEFYGIGIPDVLVDLQAELNTNRNMRIDYAAMTLRRMWKVRKDCGLTPKDLVWRQGGILQVNEMDDVEEILVQQLPASTFSNEDIIKQDMRDATGCHDIIMGIAPTDETATTTMTKDNNASLRFKFFISSLVEDILVPIAKKCVSLDQQFMNEERVIRLVGDEADQVLAISPEDLLGNYDIIYVGTSVEPMASKELYKEKVLQTYNLIVGNPIVAEAPETQLALIEELLGAMEIKDKQSIVQPLRPVVDFQNRTREKVRAMQEQQVNQQQMQMQMQGAMFSPAPEPAPAPAPMSAAPPPEETGEMMM